MNEQLKEPGIRYESVTITQVNFERKHEVTAKGLKVEFDQKNYINEDKTDLQAVLQCNIYPEDNSFKIEVTIVGRFKKDQADEGIDLYNFAEYHAPAHIFPFIREFIVSLTIRSGIGPLYLPPTNIVKVIKENKAKTD